MKFLIVSDIHGSLPRLEAVLHFFEAQSYDMLVILGDILNYGPRNGVPEGLNAPAIVESLNRYASRIVAVRGNCDAEVDQMLLKFPMMADYSMLVVSGKRILLTHGHKSKAEDYPEGYDVYISGHTHLWMLEGCEGGRITCNTGSITFPKGGNIPTFATLEEDGQLCIRALDGQIQKSISIVTK